MLGKINGQFMKKKLNCQFTLPNLEEVERYLVNPYEGWKEEIYKKVPEIAIEILNRHQFEFKAMLADHAVCAAGLQFASAEAENKVASITSEFFTPYFAKGKVALEKLINEPWEDDIICTIGTKEELIARKNNHKY